MECEVRMKYINTATNEVIETLVVSINSNYKVYLLAVDIECYHWKKTDTSLNTSFQIELMGQETWDNLDPNKCYYWYWYKGEMIPDCKILRAMYGIKEVE